MAHLPRVWLHVIHLIENRAVMKVHLIISSLALVCSCWTLDLFAAVPSSPDSSTGAGARGISSVRRNVVSIGPTALIGEFDPRDLSNLNLLGIRYAKGQGVNRDPTLAMRLFRLSALNGYTPAMANVGTLYETGATGRPNQYRAYAWVRAALSFGLPEEDHDATVLKLGMIAARLGSNNIGAAERLADAIATRVVETCQCSPGQETELASNGSL